MTKRTGTDGTGDSDNLQALFDNIAAGENGAAATGAPSTASVPTATTPAATLSGTDDSDELQALFDTESGKFETPAPEGGGEEGGQDAAMFNRIGKMTRKLHDTLVELGLDNALQEVADTIPDARQRLTYVAQMTEQAASKVLNATDIAKPVVDRIQSGAETLRADWDKVFVNQIPVDEFKLLAERTRAFLGSVTEDGHVLNAQLLDIMMAQDFQDLTGQVIKKTVEMAQALESQLLEMLIEVAPEDICTEKASSLLNGPVINGEGRDDVVNSQAQVDDLLESLGF